MKKIIIAFVLLLLTVVGLGIAKFGLRDGIKINVMAMLCAIENRVPDNTVPEGIRVFNITIKQKNWDVLTANLPLSGREKQDIIFEYEGESYKAKLRTRGHLKLHWGGQKKSIRVYFDDDDSPFGTIDQMNFLNPKTFQFTNDHIGTWVGKTVGTKTLKNEMVFLRINGENYGLMEMIEQPGRKYAINNDLGDKKVTIFKGDYLRDEEGHAKSVNLWKSATNWKGKKASNTAISKLESLVNVLNNDTMTLEQRFSGIENHVMIDEYLKYYAALTVINTEHIDQTHNQVIVYEPNSEKYYPVLWDPTFMWVHEPDRFYNFYDPLSYYILQNPIWREQRDMHIYNYLIEWYDSGKFMAYHKQLEEDLWSAVKLDHKKCNPIGADLNTVYRFSNSIYSHSNRKLRTTADTYYKQLKKDIDNTSIKKLDIENTGFQIIYNSYSPIILNIECEEEILTANIELKNSVGKIMEVNGKNLKIKLYGQIEHEDGPDGSMYKIFSGFVNKTREEQINIGAKIKNIEIYNAFTNDMISY